MKEFLRFLFAIIISFMVLYIFNSLYKKKTPEPPSSTKKVKKDTVIVKKKPEKTIEKCEKLFIDKFIFNKISFELGILKDSSGIIIGNIHLPDYKVNISSPCGFILTQDSLKLSSYEKYKDSIVFFAKGDTDQIFIKIKKIDKPYFLKIESNLPNIKVEVPDGIKFTESIKAEKPHVKFFYKNVEKIVFLSPGKLKNFEKKRGIFYFVGIKSKYFMVSIVNPEGKKVEIAAEKLNDNNVGFTVFLKEPISFSLVTAPLDYELLKSFHLGFENLVSLGGWYRFISVGILKLLKFFYSIFHNYGIAIIIFALLIKVVFSPLSLVSHKSMRRMQMLQPKIEEIRKKYKNDPQKMNQEIMKLYQLYKVNPFSGCLPLLIQLPVFIALYSVLRNAIELRKAPFIKLFSIGNKAWLVDLSQKDPFYILPIAMGIAYIAQNILTNPNPRQKWMTFLLPIFITVLFLSFPSGLQLYWFVFNLLSIAEHYIIQRGGITWKK